MWQGLPTGIKLFVLETLTIFGIGHYLVYVVLIAFRNLLFQIIKGLPFESKMTSKIIRFILWYCYSKIILHWIYRFPFIKESWNEKYIFAKTVEKQANLLLHLYVQTQVDCFYDRTVVFFATMFSESAICNQMWQSVCFDRFLPKIVPGSCVKMLTFCYPGLNKVTLVNQLSLLLIFKTTISETWNAATAFKIERCQTSIVQQHECYQVSSATVSFCLFL